VITWHIASSGKWLLQWTRLRFFIGTVCFLCKISLQIRDLIQVVNVRAVLVSWGQYVCKWCIDVYSRAVLEDDAFTRMKGIVKWYLSGFYKKPKGLKKPYNPILGETFRCYWKHPNGSRTFYLAEQVNVLMYILTVGLCVMLDPLFPLSERITLALNLYFCYDILFRWYLMLQIFVPGYFHFCVFLFFLLTKKI